ncbi:MAG: TetR/AcrR family transcriptional regulator [Caldilineaceae bacterium]|nr:TetR/AcrR family transcriptional regulator [Caldilineaceae bacterium]
MAEKVDRRVRRSRRLLADALLALVIEKRFGDISVQDIADRADMNRATFYLHFHSKEELLLSALVEQFDELVNSFGDISPDRPLWEDAQMEVMVFEHVAENARIYKALLDDPNLGLVIHAILGYIAEFSERKLAASLPAGTQPRVPLPLIAHHIGGSLYGIIHWWLRHDMPYAPTEIAQMTHLLWSQSCGDLLKSS